MDVSQILKRMQNARSRNAVNHSRLDDEQSEAWSEYSNDHLNEIPYNHDIDESIRKDIQRKARNSCRNKNYVFPRSLPPTQNQKLRTQSVLKMQKTPNPSPAPASRLHSYALSSDFQVAVLVPESQHIRRLSNTRGGRRQQSPLRTISVRKKTRPVLRSQNRTRMSTDYSSVPKQRGPSPSGPSPLGPSPYLSQSVRRKRNARSVHKRSMLLNSVERLLM